MSGEIPIGFGCTGEGPVLEPRYWARLVFIEDYRDARTSREFRRGQTGLMRNVPIGSASYFLELQPFTEFVLEVDPRKIYFIPSNYLEPI